MSALYGMPTIEIPAQDSMSAMPVADGAMPNLSATQVPPAIVPTVQQQGGMPGITPDSKADKNDKKKNELSIDKKDSPSILQMKELKFVDESLKGVGKIVDLFVGPFEDFGDVIPPTISSLFGPLAHIHWSLIIRSLQKRIKKAREEFATLIGQAKPVEAKPKKPDQPVDFMVAMQQEIQKKDPEKKKLAALRLMPKQVVKKIYDELLSFVKKATKPLDKKSLAVAELFEPLPAIPFLVTVSDVHLALHILSLQQRMTVIEESLKNKLEPLDDIKKRALKNAVKVVDLDPMVAMAAAPEPTPEQKKKAEEDAKKKKKEKKDEAPGVKLKDTKQVQSIYSAFKKIDSMMNTITKPIAKLSKDLPAMPIPLISFLGAFIGLSSLPMVFSGIMTPLGLLIGAQGAAVYGIAQTQFAIYVRNLQQLLGKIEGDIKNYHEAKKQSGIYDPSKLLAQGQAQMVQPDQSALPQDAATMPVPDGSEQGVSLPGISDAGAMSAADVSAGDASGIIPSE